MASRSIKRMRTGSGKVLVQNSADIFRKCTASRKEEEEEEREGKKLAGLHLIVGYFKQGNRFYGISCYDEKWSRQSNYVRFPFPTKSPLFLGSCNGLLFIEFRSTLPFSNGIGTNCVVWEPSTNKFQVIPQPSSMNRPCFCKSENCVTDVSIDGGGLYFDSQTGDYKFISFTTNGSLYRSEDCPMFHNMSEHFQVYSVKNNVWKEFTYPLSKVTGEPVIGEGDGICVNGVCYWAGRCSIDCSYILSFNFVTEELSSFHSPKLNENYDYSFVELDGSLGLLIYPKVREAEADWKGMISLMVYSSSSSSSWSTVDGFEVPVVGFHQPLWFGKRNDTYYLLLRGPQDQVLEYDYTRKVFNQIQKKMPNPRNYYTSMFAYETNTKNNANIWHSSSFHEVEVQKRFTVHATECDQRGGDDY